MSLVERALKKLQETKQTPGASSPGVAAPVLARESAVSLPNRSVAPQRSVTADGQERVVEPPSRIIRIDREALRKKELLPPRNLERLIASQYQQIKRPLISAALGKTGSPLVNGCAIMLSSALPEEGKTFTSINLALSMAMEKDIEVLLADADVAKPHVSRLLGMHNERGLLDLLTDSNLAPESVILRTDVPGLTVMSAGTQTPMATELLASERMEQVVAQLAPAHGRRIVLFDSPPLLLSTESRALVASMGQVVLVVRAEATLQRAVLDAIDAIGDGKPISLILNQSSTPPSGGYYGYGSYGDVPSDNATTTA